MIRASSWVSRFSTWPLRSSRYRSLDCGPFETATKRVWSGVRVGCIQLPEAISEKVPPLSLKIFPSWITNMVPGRRNFGLVTVGRWALTWTVLLLTLPK